jgi:hypothetical protein
MPIAHFEGPPTETRETRQLIVLMSSSYVEAPLLVAGDLTPRISGGSLMR